ncbi:MAG: glutamate formimidoyltransferase [Bacteroidales bacterium]|jgi:glutamate formiminotransferase/formiminotetrahydrofolate cyclodeaminase|nr:glutamate formimidoyltransferase [Bacteroidales bacterium]
MRKIIECVPNFSEGRDSKKIKEITDAIESVPGIKLLNVDSGMAANRTVVTFAGEPEFVAEAAFRGIKKASEVIDMRYHKGVHPRFGAADVCPLVPVANITMDEVIVIARKLSERVGMKLGIPVFCYEFAAFKKERESLANCRSGEYEKLKDRISSEKWKPDFGPSKWNETVAVTGASAIGARNFLVAYNVNLNTAITGFADSIASDIRESGRIIHKGNTGDKPLRIHGSLKKTRAIGWYIEEYGIVQVSLNLTDISVTPVHVAFDEICKRAHERGIRVTGSELVGMIPLSAMLDAGKYFLAKQQHSIDVSCDEIIETAIKALGLNELAPFNPQNKIIEYAIANNS